MPTTLDAFHANDHLLLLGSTLSDCDRAAKAYSGATQCHIVPGPEGRSSLTASIQ
jgi:hypothetical protein